MYKRLTCCAIGACSAVYEPLTTCLAGACAAVHEGDDHFVIVGADIAEIPEGINVGEKETAIRLPRSVLMEAIEKINAS